MQLTSNLRLVGVFALLLFHNAVADSAEDDKARLILIGDSTVKNGSGRGDGGLWGWGQVLAEHFDTERIDIENRALGGRSSRTYLTEGLWERSLARLRPGDFVLMQFGHNDGGEKFKGKRPRASIKGNGDESVKGVVEQTGKSETVHSYGWYLRKYIADAQSKGAVPIVLSLVPRDRWVEGRVIRSNNDYGKWAADAAADGNAFFIDLNEIAALRYESFGEEKVGRDFFTEKDWTHTTQAGAKINAACVVDGIRQLQDCKLKSYLIPTAPKKDGQQTSWKFHFGTDDAAPSSVSVLPSNHYSPEVGYGFEPETAGLNIIQTGDDADAITSDSPFYFSVRLPEGNYRVHIVGGREPLTVKAELRRLMIEGATAPADGPVACEFTVNVRRTALPDGRQVRLKPRERESEIWAWDEKLTLEINGPHPTVSAITIEQEPDAPTVFLAGDSTVADQPIEPWGSWGQMLTRFFRPGIAIANHSESGESIRSSLGAHRFDKIFSLMRPGDYLFFQFGHNDMKEKSPDALVTYRSNLVSLVRKTLELKGRPVLVTSMERKPGPNTVSLGDYPQTVRDVAAELGVPLIDLNTMSQTLYSALGDELDAAFQDETHHTNYGSYLLAKCVVQGIVDNRLGLADWIREDFGEFTPYHPESKQQVNIPASPSK